MSARKAEFKLKLTGQSPTQLDGKDAIRGFVSLDTVRVQAHARLERFFAELDVNCRWHADVHTQDNL